jgi:hypothetical protein
MKKQILILLINFCCLHCFSQVDLALSKRTKNIPIEILVNKTVGFNNSKLAQLKIKYIDAESKDIYSNIEIIFTNLESLKSYNFDTEDLKVDENGFRNIFVDSANYNIEIRNSSYGKTIIELLKLESGQVQEININMGSKIVISCGQTIPGEIIVKKNKTKKTSH